MSDLCIYGVTFDVITDYEPEWEDKVVNPYFERLERVGATLLDASFVFDHGAAGVGASGSWKIGGMLDVADFAAALAKAAEACVGIGDDEVFSIGVHEAAREDYGM